jgi:hypothetical protein
MRVHGLLSSIVGLSLTACASGPTLYAGGSGGDSVYLTDQQVEVADCKPIGNIKLADSHRDYGEDNELQFRLKVARLGGNTGLVIAGTPDRPLKGVAFKCRPS